MTPTAVASSLTSSITASSTPAPNTLVRPDLVVANITIIPGKPLDNFGNVTISGTLTVDARQIINKTVDMFDIQLFNYTDKTDPIPKVDVLIGGDSCLEVKSARTRGVDNGGDRKTFTVRVQVGLRRECVMNTTTATQGNVVPEGEFPVVAVAAGAAGGLCCLLLTVVIGVVICRKADRGADENERDGFVSSATTLVDTRKPIELHNLRHQYEQPHEPLGDGIQATASARLYDSISPADAAAMVAGPDGIYDSVGHTGSLGRSDSAHSESAHYHRVGGPTNNYDAVRAKPPADYDSVGRGAGSSKTYDAVTQPAATRTYDAVRVAPTTDYDSVGKGGARTANGEYDSARF
jgi:hypothetical protein